MKPDHVPIARLASLIVFAVACSSGITELPARSAPIQAIDVPAGGFPLSITAAPAKDVGSWEQYLAAYELADELGFSIAHNYMEWGVIEPDAGEYAWENPGYFYTLAEQRGMRVSMELTIINIEQLGQLPKDLEGKTLADPQLRGRFLAFLEEFATRGRDHLDYLWIGNEIDTYLGQNPDELEPWMSLYRAAIEVVHREAPGVKVGTVMTYHGALESGRTSWIDKWGPDSDVVGVTYYPQFMPNGYEPDRIQEQFDDLVEAYGEYPIALVETAVAAASPYGGGEDEQVTYARELFEALDRHKDDFVFAGWFLLHDFSPQWLDMFTSGNSNRDLRRWLSSLALAGFDGRPRPVLSVWAEEARRFYSTQARAPISSAPRP